MCEGLCVYLVIPAKAMSSQKRNLESARVQV